MANKSKVNFVKGTISRTNLKAVTQFHPANSLPRTLPVTTPMTFPIYNEKYVLTKEKNGWRNPIGGHVKENESWLTALRRESLEEAGCTIRNITLFGYLKTFLIHKRGSCRYPEKSCMPFTMSLAFHIAANWKPLGTLERGLFNKGEVINMLARRGDGGQMLEIFNYLSIFNTSK